MLDTIGLICLAALMILWLVCLIGNEALEKKKGSEHKDGDN